MKDLLNKYKKRLIASALVLLTATAIFFTNGDVSQFIKVVDAFQTGEISNTSQVLEDALKAEDLTPPPAE